MKVQSFVPVRFLPRNACGVARVVPRLMDAPVLQFFAYFVAEDEGVGFMLGAVRRVLAQFQNALQLVGQRNITRFVGLRDRCRQPTRADPTSRHASAISTVRPSDSPSPGPQ